MKKEQDSAAWSAAHRVTTGKWPIALAVVNGLLTYDFFGKDGAHYTGNLGYAPDGRTKCEKLFCLECRTVPERCNFFWQTSDMSEVKPVRSAATLFANHKAATAYKVFLEYNGVCDSKPLRTGTRADCMNFIRANRGQALAQGYDLALVNTTSGRCESYVL
jgi:hypothetical protein